MIGHLRGIQVLRAIAATAVMASHLVIISHKYFPNETLVPAVLKYGAAGVDMFFVVSGFVMVHVTANYSRGPLFAANFLWKRIARIYPTLWFYLLLLLPVLYFAPHMINSAYGTPNIIASFLLVPTAQAPLLAVAWSLQFEMFFYLVFALFLAVLPCGVLRIGLLAWTAVTFVGAWFVNAHSHYLMQFFFSPFVLEFIAGCFVAYTAPKIGSKSGVILIASGVAWFVAGCLMLESVDSSSRATADWVLAFGPASVAIVAGVVAWESSVSWRRFPAILVAIGDSSYSLYLSHLLTLSALGRLWMLIGIPLPPVMNLAVIALFGAIAVVVGHLSYLVVEKPVIRFFRSRPQSATPVQTASGATSKTARV